MALLSMRQYAMYRGVTVSAVSRAIRDGRITCVKDSKGRAKIEPNVADAQWNSGTDPAARGNVPSQVELGDAQDETGDATHILNTYKAKMAKLEFEERSGELHEIEKCKRDAFKAGRAIRDALLSIPDRLSAELAGETDQFAVRKRLDDEIRQALEALADDLDEGDDEDMLDEPESIE